MPKPLFILRPTGLFCRFRVPIDLRLQVGSQFLVRSLHTVDKDRARLLAAILGVALGEMFERLRQGINVDVKKVLASLDPATIKKWEANEVSVQPGADKIYFFGWLNHDGRSSKPSEDNLTKTRRICGQVTYELCHKHHISSRWSDDPDRALQYYSPPNMKSLAN